MSTGKQSVIRLNQRIYGPYGSKGFNSLKRLLNHQMKALRIRILGYSIRSDGWVEVSLEGEDLEAGLNLLHSTIGILPNTSSDLFKGCMLKCRVLTLKNDGLYADIGLKDTIIIVPIDILRSQLFDGHGMTITDIESLYMLYTDFPIELYVRNVSNGRVICAFSWRWLKWVENIIASNHNRIYVTGVDIDTVEDLLNRKPYVDYILEVIRLGVLETLLLIDPLANLYKLYNYMEKNLKPSILRFSKTPKSFRKISYTIQDEAWFNPPPPFQIS